MVDRAGLQRLALSRRLGHTRPSVTLDVYSHLFPGGDAEIAEALDRFRAASVDRGSAAPVVAAQ